MKIQHIQIMWKTLQRNAINTQHFLIFIQIVNSLSKLLCCETWIYYIFYTVRLFEISVLLNMLHLKHIAIFEWYQLDRFE